MSHVSGHAAVHAQVAAYYGGKLATHGPTPAGVDWNSLESQQLRFRQLARIWEGATPSTVIDYGCGYGALADFIAGEGLEPRYTGYDLAPSMVAAAKVVHAKRQWAHFTDQRAELKPADYALASGIFNVKLDTPADRWREYMLDTIDDMASLSTRGFAFNALTSYSDPDRQRPDLYYADPTALFDRCKRRYSRFVTLVHDYPLYEFTILVRLAGMRHG
jgi:SAM-dependent methyltransferase